MTEDRVAFLCNIALNLSPKNDIHRVLKSFYLMRCNQVAKGYGLPPKYFSPTVRCPRCYSEWTRDSFVKIQPSKLSRRQEQRIKSKHKKNNTQKHKKLLQNEMVQVCTFCKQSSTIQLTKPESLYRSTLKEHNIFRQENPTKQGKKKAVNNLEPNKKSMKSKPDKKENAVNIYTKAFDVFSLKNDKNTLTSMIKDPPKIIKNNKKRKDKFAGLCEKAVLASTKQKEQQTLQQPQQRQNKLNLFLKPSMG